MYLNKKGNFDSEDFWNYVENEGKKHVLAGSETHFHARPDIPHYYDEMKFKRAQDFFQANIAGMTMATLCGIITVLAEPEDVQLLIATSREPVTDYKRYKETILHVYSWYQNELTPESKLWKSITYTRKRHDFAINLGIKGGIRTIDQANLVTIQYSLVVLILLRQKEFGFQSATKEDLEAIVHFWRVVGYLIGIEDRFNMCRESLEETLSLCEEKMRRTRQSLLAKHESALRLQFYALSGLYPTFRILPETLMNLVYDLVEPKRKCDEMYRYKIDRSQKISIAVFTKLIELCRYNTTKKVMNMYFRYVINIWTHHSILVEEQLLGIQQSTLI